MNGDRILEHQGSTADLLRELRRLGFTPETHPNLVKDMQRAFKEASAHSGISMGDRVSVRFRFAPDDSVTAEIEKD